MRIIKIIDEIWGRIEEWFLTIALAFTIFLAFYQVILRNVFSTGITWGDEILRHLVLWLGFIGASLATREGRHITIDVISRTLNPRIKRWTDPALNLFTSLICIILLISAIRFVSIEFKYGELSASLRIGVWILELIFPITFLLLSIRFFLRFIEGLFRRV